jgi:Fic family protein
MKNLEQFINDDSISDLDPIIKMAVIHLQFESIHPFYDGNGRTGRIIYILYLINQKLLNLPILYLSNYIIKNKGKYYELLQTVRSENRWEEWLIYMIDSVEKTSIDTIQLIGQIKELMQELKVELRNKYKFYSQDLLNNLFKHPYSKIEFLVRDLQVSRLTAANYLNKLSKDGILRKEKLGKSNYYINEKLFELLKKR